ncbi:MAG: glycerophosphodiester phosphodiesterase [Myxococcota bacterium]
MKPYFGRGRLLIAHRGGAQRWPENTLFAFQKAYDLGYRWIETDVHLSADGEVVIFHDETLERTTNGKGAVSQRTLAELKTLDAGCRFERGETRPYAERGLRIPTLEEALALAPDLRLNLEMKGRDPALADRLWEVIQAHGVHDRVLAAAANDSLTARFRRHAGDRVATSAGRDGIIRFWLSVQSRTTRWLSFPFDALQVPIKQGVLRVVDERFVEAARAKGIAVHVWTINNPIDMRWLDAIGVDGIMTDRPEVLLETLAR